MGEINFFKVKDLKVKRVLEDSSIRVVTNKNTMVSFFEFGPKTKIMPRHQHPHEQISFVLEGSTKMTVGEESKILKIGEGVVIPPNIEHEAAPLEPHTKIMDLFYPIRQEYLE